MNRYIVMKALRSFVLNTFTEPDDRADALQELLNLQRIGCIEYNSMERWRQHRTNGDRISTIKMIRKDLDCGLAEALIIVKGIESHDDIK